MIRKFDTGCQSTKQEKTPNQLVSLGDLQEFKEELLLSIGMIVQNKAQNTTKRWLKSSEVIKLLKVSHGTLHSLRMSGTLPSTKVGGLVFYDQDEIEKVLTGEKKSVLQNRRRL